jgi:hypothetical protein
VFHKRPADAGELLLRLRGASDVVSPPAAEAIPFAVVAGTRPDSPGGGTGSRVAAGVLGSFGAVMVFLSGVDAGVGGISEGGLLIGALLLGAAYALWPRDGKPGEQQRNEPGEDR